MSFLKKFVYFTLLLAAVASLSACNTTTDCPCNSSSAPVNNKNI